MPRDEIMGIHGLASLSVLTILTIIAHAPPRVGIDFPSEGVNANTGWVNAMLGEYCFSALHFSLRQGIDFLLSVRYINFSTNANVSGTALVPAFAELARTVFASSLSCSVRDSFSQRSYLYGSSKFYCSFRRAGGGNDSGKRVRHGRSVRE